MDSNPLENHFLSSFQRTKEPFAIINGVVYTTNKSDSTNNNENVFHLEDESFVLEESEEISVLEKNLFYSKRDELEKIMSEYVKNTISKTKTGVADLKQLINYYKYIKDMSIEQFIMIDVFDAYNNGNENILKKPDTDIHVPEIRQMPAIEDLLLGDNLLDSIINSPGVIVLNDECYQLSSKNNNEKPYLQLENSNYDITPWISLDELCDKYTQLLTNHVRDTAEQDADDFSRLLRQIRRDKQYWERKIKNRKSIDKTSSKQGLIGFQKITSNLYEINVIVPPYIIKKDNKYYAFGQVVIGLTICAEGNSLRLENPPHVLNGPYEHPFVYGSSFNYEICYGDLNWARKLDIFFNHNYNLTSTLAKKIAHVLRESERTLLKGYLGNKLNPVKKIEYFNPIAHSKNGAEAYARKNNISLDRIIDNH